MINSFMRFIVLSLFLMSGCGMIVTHEKGSLPKLEFPQAEKYRTKDFDAEIKTDKFELSCDVHF